MFIYTEVALQSKISGQHLPLTGLGVCYGSAGLWSVNVGLRPV